MLLRYRAWRRKERDGEKIMKLFLENFWFGLQGFEEFGN